MDKRKVEIARKATFRAALLVTSYLLLVTTIGCEAFVRKFTRKTKEKPMPQEQIVLRPKEYAAEKMSSEEAYSYHYLYWKSWQDELISALSDISPNHKKEQECVKEAYTQLQEMRKLLNADKQKEIDEYVERLGDLKAMISADIYGYNNRMYRLKAQRLKREISKEFSVRKMKDFLE